MSSPTILLDLGNVVMGVDFRRTFRHWADSAAIDVGVFYERWSQDHAYEAHERGEINFTEYSRHLAETFEVDMPEASWRAGWNDLFEGPFAEVVALLPEIAARYPLYAFTNTNATHTTHWQALYPESFNDFRHVFISNEIGMRKPEVEAYRYVCKEMDSSPGDVIFLDDNHDNIAGALATGLDARLVESEAAVVTNLKSLL